jgi:hypothetical protein
LIRTSRRAAGHNAGLFKTQEAIEDEASAGDTIDETATKIPAK